MTASNDTLPSKLVLAIDQSIASTGWAFVTKDGVLSYGAIRPAKFSKADPANLKRLYHIFREVTRLIAEHGRKPDCLVLERYFTGIKGRNNGTTVVPELRGALKILAAINEIPFRELAPQTYRCGLLGKGNGNADKEKVAKYVKRKTGIDPKKDNVKGSRDITDAIAMGLFMAQLLETSG